MLRGANSAFTRVFDALCLRRDALLIRSMPEMGPGSADQRYRTMLRIAQAAPRPGQVTAPIR
jgi:hypothetical protein